MFSKKNKIKFLFTKLNKYIEMGWIVKKSTLKYDLFPEKNYVPEQTYSNQGAHLLNNPQKNDGPQETYESNEEVSPLTKDQ